MDNWTKTLKNQEKYSGFPTKVGKDIVKVCSDFEKWCGENDYGMPWDNMWSSVDGNPFEIIADNVGVIDEIAIYPDMILFKLRKGISAEKFYWEFVARTRPDEYRLTNNVVRVWWD